MQRQKQRRPYLVLVDVLALTHWEAAADCHGAGSRLALRGLMAINVMGIKRKRKTYLKLGVDVGGVIVNGDWSDLCCGAEGRCWHRHQWW